MRYQIDARITLEALSNADALGRLERLLYAERTDPKRPISDPWEVIVDTATVSKHKDQRGSKV